jgi:hypothetical protein
VQSLAPNFFAFGKKGGNAIDGLEETDSTIPTTKNTATKNLTIFKLHSSENKM